MMKVRVLIPHRVDTVREDGSPGFLDRMPGDVIEISDDEFSTAFYEAVEAAGFEPRAPRRDGARRAGSESRNP